MTTNVMMMMVVMEMVMVVMVMVMVMVMMVMVMVMAMAIRSQIICARHLKTAKQKKTQTARREDFEARLSHVLKPTSQ